jgi:hypothetical protein
MSAFPEKLVPRDSDSIERLLQKIQLLALQSAPSARETYLRSLPAVTKTFTVAASDAEYELLPLQEGFVQRIVAAHWLCGDTATTLAFSSKDEADALTGISGVYANAANGGIVLPFNISGHFADAALDEGISLTTGAGSDIVGSVTYIKIPLSAFITDNAGDILTWNDGTPY